jgi:hypothetical protein
MLRLLLAAMLMFGAGLALAQDDPPGRVGRIAALHGEVWVFDAEQGDWVAATRNRPLTHADRISTTAAGNAELRIGSTTLYLGSGSELEALRLDDDAMVFQLHQGSLAMRVRSREIAAELQLVTAEGSFQPERAGLYRVDRRDDSSDASVWRGELRFRSDDTTLVLQPGQRAEFEYDDRQRQTRSRWLTPLNDDFARAVLREDQAEERSVASRYVSPEMTGIEDLDQYGRWQQHPDIGAIWIPSTVAVGWAPYRQGHWAWLLPWGWTWVDDAPWGFAPFHYGRWLWWGGNWCWSPGPRVARPVFAPALVGWVGGAQAQVVVTIGGRRQPAVGWIPLAPHEAYRPAYRTSPGYMNRINPYPQRDGGHRGYRNRSAPGAITLLPTNSMLPHKPIAGVAVRGDPAVLPDDRFHHSAPGRPGRGLPLHKSRKSIILRHTLIFLAQICGISLGALNDGKTSIRSGA